ncbi:hypothetical protein [Adoxophyes orana nucleopolyhedrovirus]|uniref:hypothetical protein n=1 Tax=Adoxophyes orana nucleopolyhedrovirus TaxID=542343 RepID=UPI0001829BFC|nr:hypothetical protein [Adoxophyes orana nucleopolyhedrovirus]ACF05336.1 hypothetical protein [Adoxophyes orana nucleopolyhedrovirus]
MLVIVSLNDKTEYLYRSFKQMWKNSFIECHICYDKINNDGIVAITDNGNINLEKMFHNDCIKRWRQSNSRDPFNRNVKFWFQFPPQTLMDCKNLIDQINKFIGDHDADKKFAQEFERVNNNFVLDIELDFEKMMRYTS